MPFGPHVKVSLGHKDRCICTFIIDSLPPLHIVVSVDRAESTDIME